jgi:hypothetical protein
VVRGKEPEKIAAARAAVGAMLASFSEYDRPL